MTETWRQFLPSQERIEDKHRAKMRRRHEQRLWLLLSNRVSSVFHGSPTFQLGLSGLLGLPALQKLQAMVHLRQVALGRKQVGGGWGRELWRASSAVSMGKAEDSCSSYVQREGVHLSITEEVGKGTHCSPSCSSTGPQGKQLTLRT